MGYCVACGEPYQGNNHHCSEEAERRAVAVNRRGNTDVGPRAPSVTERWRTGTMLLSFADDDVYYYSEKDCTVKCSDT